LVGAADCPADHGNAGGVSDTFNDIVIGTGIAAEGPPLRREEGRCRHFVLRRPIELRLYVLAVNDSFGRVFECQRVRIVMHTANRNAITTNIGLTARRETRSPEEMLSLQEASRQGT
jgi:hypothetical protein